MRKYQALIFDWDGTLVDSIGRIVTSLRVAAERCGLDQLPEARLRGIIGLGLPEAIRSLYPDLHDPARVKGFREAYSDHYLVLESEPSRLFPGVAEALDSFRAQGYRLAVATGKSRHGLQRVLEGRGWENYFDITRCADETASKPHPLMLEEILAHFGLPPRAALMVGDSPFDLQMARNVGMDAVAVGYGAVALEQLREQAPVLAIDEFVQLRRWLEVGAPLGLEETADVG